MLIMFFLSFFLSSRFLINITSIYTGYSFANQHLFQIKKKFCSGKLLYVLWRLKRKSVNAILKRYNNKPTLYVYVYFFSLIWQEFTFFLSKTKSSPFIPIRSHLSFYVSRGRKWEKNSHIRDSASYALSKGKRKTKNQFVVFQCSNQLSFEKEKKDGNREK